MFDVSLHRISETPRFLLPNPVKLARTLTRFEQGFNEVFKNPLQREIVVFGRILATAISPQGDINYSLFIKPKPPHGVGEPSSN